MGRNVPVLRNQHGEGLLHVSHPLEMLADLGALLLGDLRRREQRDMGRDRPGRRITEGRSQPLAAHQRTAPDGNGHADHLHADYRLLGRKLDTVIKPWPGVVPATVPSPLGTFGEDAGQLGGVCQQGKGWIRYGVVVSTTISATSSFQVAVTPCPS